MWRAHRPVCCMTVGCIGDGDGYCSASNSWVRYVWPKTLVNGEQRLDLDTKVFQGQFDSLGHTKFIELPQEFYVSFTSPFMFILVPGALSDSIT